MYSHKLINCHNYEPTAASNHVLLRSNATTVLQAYFKTNKTKTQIQVKFSEILLRSTINVSGKMAPDDVFC